MGILHIFACIYVRDWGVVFRWTEKVVKQLSWKPAAAWFLETTLRERMRWPRTVLIGSGPSPCQQVLFLIPLKMTK